MQMVKLHLCISLYVGMSKVPVISQFNKFINLLDLIQCSQNPMEIIPSTSKDPLAV